MTMQPLEYRASPEIRDLILSIGRTEDIKFSPNESLFAITEFLKDKIRLLEVSIGGEGSSQVITISKCTTVVSNHLKGPHGITFLDNEYFVVANRNGDVNLFKYSPTSAELSEVELTPLITFRGRRFLGRIYSPGSVDCYRIKDDRYRVLVCNNYIHTVVSFDVELTDNIRVKNNGLLLKLGLDIPDGISISLDRKWVAISNHQTEEVLIYRLLDKTNLIAASFGIILNRFVKPVGKLIGTRFPHGVRFSKDGTRLFVSDAGGQNLNIYQSSDGRWDKILEPNNTAKMINDETFEKEWDNLQEGGVKGLDLANNDQLLATTTEHQQLSFYAVNNLFDSQDR